MRGSIVKRKGRSGPLYYVVLRNRWYRVPDPQTKRNAETYRAQLVAELSRGTLVEPSSETVRVFVDRWRAARYDELSHYTQRSYEAALRNHILPAFGERTLAAIGREDIDRWLAGLRGRLAPRSAALVVAVLSAVFNAAVAWRYLLRSPLEGVRRAPGPRVREPAYLEPDQIRAFLAAVGRRPDPIHWRALFLLAITGGLRLGEIIAVRWANLDVEGRRYLVRESYVHTKAFKGFRAPKTAGSLAPVTVTPETMEALQALRSAQAADRLARGEEPAELAFERQVHREPGRPMGPRTAIRNFRAALADADLPPIRFHDLRHTCAALWISLGSSAKAVQTQMRHTSIKTTFDVYGHLFEADQDAAALRMDALIRG